MNELIESLKLIYGGAEELDCGYIVAGGANSKLLIDMQGNILCKPEYTHVSYSGLDVKYPKIVLSSKNKFNHMAFSLRDNSVNYITLPPAYYTSIIIFKKSPYIKLVGQNLYSLRRLSDIETPLWPRMQTKQIKEGILDDIIVGTVSGTLVIYDADLKVKYLDDASGNVLRIHTFNSTYYIILRSDTTMDILARDGGKLLSLSNKISCLTVNKEGLLLVTNYSGYINVYDSELNRITPKVKVELIGSSLYSITHQEKGFLGYYRSGEDSELELVSKNKKAKIK